MVKLYIMLLCYSLQFQTQSERLVKINLELRRKNSSHRKHARTLISEKVELETQLAEKESQIHRVKELMNEESLDDGHVVYEKLRNSVVSIPHICL